MNIEISCEYINLVTAFLRYFLAGIGGLTIIFGVYVWVKIIFGGSK